ncbi:MAG: hypothetical protein Q6J68_02575 [Thermostichales cyanobacterium SZTDM-1c_bins_54]
MRIVFSSLSTLIDPLRLSYGAVRPALLALERRAIPLVLCSYRTLEELQDICQQWHLHHPLVVEGGSAVYVPLDYFPASVFDQRWQIRDGWRVLVCGELRPRLKPILHHLRTQLQADLISFADWTASELALTLGIPLAAAEKAQHRLYSEVFSYSGDPERLRAALAAAPPLGFPLRVQRLPVPFPPHYWLLNAHHGQGIPMLLQCYRQHLGHVLSFGVGWDPQDQGFLPWMDQAVILPGEHEEMLRQSLWPKAELPPPEGWNEAVLQWLEATDPQDEREEEGI